MRGHAGSDGKDPNGKDLGVSADKTGMRDRRSEIRMLCADMVEVGWIDNEGKRGQALALLEDISPSGACLQLEMAIPMAAQVSWESPKQMFNGSVRYCVYREIGYFVGVQFDESCKWSKKTFRPQHLLDLKRLMNAGPKGRN